MNTRPRVSDPAALLKEYLLTHAVTVCGGLCDLCVASRAYLTSRGLFVAELQLLGRDERAPHPVV